MSRALNDLSASFRPLAVELLARLVEAGIPLLIVCTGRTWQEHQANVARGVSWTALSKHLDGKQYRGTERGSDAIDVVPYLVYQAHGEDKLLWDGNDPVWQRIGAVGESLGLRWGGTWKTPDLGHFELVRS